MAKLGQEDILHVAKLANLKLEKEETDKYTSQLSKVIDYVSELSSVDTKNVEPTSQTTGLENVFRQDEVAVEGRLTQEEALGGSENVHNGYFRVKAILEGRTDK